MFKLIRCLFGNKPEVIDTSNSLLNIKSNKVFNYDGMSYIYIRNPKNPLVFKFITVTHNINPKDVLNIYYNIGWYCGHIAGGLFAAMKKRIDNIEGTTIHIV